MSRLATPTLILFLLAGMSATGEENGKPKSLGPVVESPVRVADVISGHVHPSLAVTRSSALLAVYNKQGGGGKELLLCRSKDGGKTWTSPVAIPGIKQCSIYPGSLTTLSDGRIILAWACYRGSGGALFRTVHYCSSSDEGASWTEPKDLPLTDPNRFTALR